MTTRLCCLVTAFMAALPLSLPASTVLAQGTSFGKVELVRPKDFREWTALLHGNIRRQIAVAQSTLQIASPTTKQKVVIRLTVHPDGAMGDIQVEETSGSSALDRAVIRVVRNAQKQPPFTPDMPNRPMEFLLPANIKP